MVTNRKQVKCPKCKQWVLGFVIATDVCADCFYSELDRKHNELALRRMAEWPKKIAE